MGNIVENGANIYYYLVMEQGESLDKWLASKRGKLTEIYFMEIIVKNMLKIEIALELFDIMHYDYKPSNFIILEGKED